MTPQEIQDTLGHFTGTEQYHKWSGQFRTFVLTDGVKFLAEACGAYWLCDAIASHRSSYKDEGFVVAMLTKQKKHWRLTLDDGNDGVLATQIIEYSDFPLDDITLYVIPQGHLWVIMLPSEC